MLIRITKDIWINPQELLFTEIEPPMHGMDRGPRVMLTFHHGVRKLLPAGVTVESIMARIGGVDNFEGDVDIWECTYESRWTDEVGEVQVCTIHEQNSRYNIQFGPHRPCLTISPYIDE